MSSLPAPESVTSAQKLKQRPRDPRYCLPDRYLRGATPTFDVVSTEYRKPYGRSISDGGLRLRRYFSLFLPADVRFAHAPPLREDRRSRKAD